MKKLVNVRQPCNNGQTQFLMSKKTSTRQISYSGSNLSKRYALAIESVELNNVSVRQAAKDYDISHHSLQRRVNGQININARPGRLSYFSDAEEREIKQWIFDCVDQGFPISRQDVIVKAKQLLQLKGIVFIIIYYFIIILTFFS